MIDFRYHLVSLISVFLALAVGIVLGAGPLREGISENLTGQVEALREARNAAEAAREAQVIETNDRDAYIAALGGQVSEGLLTGRTVAVVQLPDANADDAAAAVTALTGAGAAVVEAAMTAEWTGTDLAYRQTFAQQVAGYLDPAPAADATPEAILASATAQMLAGAGTASENAAVLQELLLGGDRPFISMPTPGAAAAAVVLVGPRPVPVDSEATATATAAEEAAPLDGVQVAGAFAAVLSAVVVGDADSLILSIREAAVPATTLDSVGEVPATVSIPLAVAYELTGSHGRFGSAPSATAPVPPVVTPPAPEPAPSPAPEEASN